MDIITKAIDVVLSCETVPQLEYARRYIELIEQHSTEDDFRGIVELYSQQYSKVLRSNLETAFD
jgi:hypothetical protein